MKRTMIMLAMAATTLMSCSKEENPNNGDPVAINFGANITLTKAVIESEGPPNRPITDVPIQIIRGKDGEKADAEWSSINAVATTGVITRVTGVVTVATQQYQNPNKKTANFIAYAPQAESLVDGVASFTINGTQDIIITEAQGVVFAPSINYCALPFTHALTQVELIVQAGDAQAIADFGVLTDASITASQEMELTLAAQSVLAPKVGGSTGAFKFYNGDTPYDGLSELTTDGKIIGRTLIFATPGEKLTAITLAFANRASADYPLGLQLVAGKKHTITATVKSSKIDVTSTVVPWDDGEDKDVTVQ